MKQTSQQKIINIIMKLNPTIGVGDAGKAYKAIKELGSKK